MNVVNVWKKIFCQKKISPRLYIIKIYRKLDKINFVYMKPLPININTSFGKERDDNMHIGREEWK